MKQKSFFSNLANLIGRLAVLVIVCLFLVNIVRSVWKNHQTEKNISDLQNKISHLENENLNLKNRILFYQTDLYKELKAKEHLGYIRKDEKLAVLVKEEKKEIVSDEVQTENQDPKYQVPNWQSWYNYIFK